MNAAEHEQKWYDENVWYNTNAIYVSVPLESSGLSIMLHASNILHSQ